MIRPEDRAHCPRAGRTQRDAEGAEIKDGQIEFYQNMQGSEHNLQN
jgi:hypothetical protein